MSVPAIFAAPDVFFTFSGSILSTTAMRKVSTGERLMKVMAKVAVVYCKPYKKVNCESAAPNTALKKRYARISSVSLGLVLLQECHGTTQL